MKRNILTLPDDEDSHGDMFVLCHRDIRYWRRSSSLIVALRSGEVPGPAVSAKDVLWRPWEEEQAEPVHTIVSIAHPSHKHPVYFASTDIRTRSDLNKGKESLD